MNNEPDNMTLKTTQWLGEKVKAQVAKHGDNWQKQEVRFPNAF